MEDAKYQSQRENCEMGKNKSIFGENDAIREQNGENLECAKNKRVTNREWEMQTHSMKRDGKIEKSQPRNFYLRR